MNFNVSEEILHSNIVGKLSYKKTCEKQNKHVKVKLENREFQVKNLEVLPVDICVLPNKKLLCANSKPWNLTLYDETLSHVGTIDQIENLKIRPLSITTNNKDMIFIACVDEIIATDLNFNIISRIGSKGCDIDQLNYPSSISFNDDYLYVCDRNNKRIQKLLASSQVQMCIVENFMLNYKPDQIKIANTTACVMKCFNNTIFFYDLDSFTFKCKYDGHNRVISEIGSIFYVSDLLNAKILCFDQNGQFLNEILNNSFKNLMKNFSLSNGKIVLFNDSVIMSDIMRLIIF